MFKFAHPEILYALLLIPLLLALFYYGVVVKGKRLKKLGEKRLLTGLMPEVSHWRPRVKFYISLVAIAIAIFVAAGPQYGTKKEKIKKQGVEMMVCIDVSNSMLSDDVKPDRMSRAKQVLGRLIDKLENDKVGLIVFDPFFERKIGIALLFAILAMHICNKGHLVYIRRFCTLFLCKGIYRQHHQQSHHQNCNSSFHIVSY